MTDEERQRLCARLRTDKSNVIGYIAADEIERLAAELHKMTKLRDQWRDTAITAGRP